MEGQTDETKVFDTRDAFGAARAARAVELSEAIKQHMSPRGALGLPPILDERRLQYGIPDQAFAEQPAFNRLYVWQLSDFDEQETFGDTSILMPETTKTAEKKSGAGGIIVGAGLVALDELRSNGIDLGHRVTFVRLAPWRRRIAVIKAMEFHLVVLQSGDIVASRDTRTLLKNGALKLETQEVQRGDVTVTCHVYVDKDGKVWHPQVGVMPEDY